MYIKNNLLHGSHVKHKLVTNKNSGKFKLLDTLLIHYTASHTTTSAYNTLKDPNNKVCTHLLIARDGDIIQLVPFDLITWHAGESRWLDRVDINQYAIGIEMVNAGPLDLYTQNRYKTWYGTDIPNSDVIVAKHKNELNRRAWHSYTDKQISELSKVALILKNTYNLKYIIGHDDVAPGRKTDPGPAFPLQQLRSTTFG